MTRRALPRAYRSGTTRSSENDGSAPEPGNRPTGQARRRAVSVAPCPNFDVLSIERDGHVATLWLDRPEARNAMGPAFWADLPLAMDELSADRAVRAIVIAARGRTSAWASTSRPWPGCSPAAPTTPTGPASGA